MRDKSSNPWLNSNLRRDTVSILYLLSLICLCHLSYSPPLPRRHIKKEDKDVSKIICPSACLLPHESLSSAPLPSPKAQGWALSLSPVLLCTVNPPGPLPEKKKKKRSTNSGSTGCSETRSRDRDFVEPPSSCLLNHALSYGPPWWQQRGPGMGKELLLRGEAPSLHAPPATAAPVLPHTRFSGSLIGTA